jgi:histidyl-tRNA synthetase
MINRIRGTRDFLDLTLFKFTLSTIKKHLELYHFQEIMTPLLEQTELFKRSLGTETDVVSKEMFLATSSSGQGSESICLRPEATASTIRAFIEGGIDQLPWKVFSFGPMFRYERPQKGRYRQFYQVNIECIGSGALSQDVQLIALLDRLFAQKLQLENYALHINFMGTPEERAELRKQLATFLEKESDICATCKTRKESNILRVFDCKSPVCQKIYKNAPALSDCFGDSSQQEWQQLQDQLEELSVSFVINPRLVRGLDYYSKTVFEFVSPDLGSQSAFCGGGRYDYLVSQLGGKQDQPSIGAAIGFDRLLLLMEMNQQNLVLPQEPALHVVLPLSQSQHGLALQLADSLLKAGLTTEILFEGSIKKMMKRANKLGASYCYILGEQEQQDGTVVVKDMQKGTEQTVKQIDAVKIIQK